MQAHPRQKSRAMWQAIRRQETGKQKSRPGKSAGAIFGHGNKPDSQPTPCAHKGQTGAGQGLAPCNPGNAKSRGTNAGPGRDRAGNLARQKQEGLPLWQAPYSLPHGRNAMYLYGLFLLTPCVCRQAAAGTANKSGRFKQYSQHRRPAHYRSAYSADNGGKKDGPKDKAKE